MHVLYIGGDESVQMKNRQTVKEKRKMKQAKLNRKKMIFDYLKGKTTG